jgi:flagellar hook-length control protein FliK
MAINTNTLRDVILRVLATQPVARIEAATDAVRTPAFRIGQMLQAQIAAMLPNDRSLIDVEGVHIDVKLPFPVPLGQTLQLQVIALEPRLTFAMQRAASGAGDAPVSMSESVRRLAAVLETLSPDAPAPETARAAPVLAAPPSDTAAFAERLKTLIAGSGLFYESHQAQWIAGERPLDDLMREPQAALKSTGDAVHPEASPMVQQQLGVLDTRQIAWSGEVWPQQYVEWRIEEEARHEAASVEAPRAWKTSLRLQLPQLGDVTATLSVRGDEVRLAFDDLQSQAMGPVRSGQPTLQHAFARSGLRLLDVAVRQSPQSGITS